MKVDNKVILQKIKDAALEYKTKLKLSDEIKNKIVPEIVESLTN